MVAGSENVVTNETKMIELIIISSQANAYIAHLIFGSNKFGEWKKKKKKSESSKPSKRTQRFKTSTFFSPSLAVQKRYIIKKYI